MGITKARLVILILIVLSPLLFAQKPSERPIVVQKEIETTIKIEQIDKDNLQRIFEDMNDRIKKLETKVGEYEKRIYDLENK